MNYLLAFLGIIGVAIILAMSPLVIRLGGRGRPLLLVFDYLGAGPRTTWTRSAVRTCFANASRISGAVMA